MSQRYTLSLRAFSLSLGRVLCPLLQQLNRYYVVRAILRATFLYQWLQLAFFRLFLSSGLVLNWSCFSLKIELLQPSFHKSVCHRGHQIELIPLCRLYPRSLPSDFLELIHVSWPRQLHFVLSLTVSHHYFIQGKLVFALAWCKLTEVLLCDFAKSNLIIFPLFDLRQFLMKFS